MTYFFTDIYESLFGTLNTTEKKIYFFDDNEENKPIFDDPNKPIKFIKIDEGKLDCENVESDSSRFDYHTKDSDLKIDFDPGNENSHEKNTYQVWKRNRCRGKKIFGDNIYLGSGLNSTHFKMINDDIDNISCIVLDWDRTITIMEGFLFPNPLSSVSDKPGKTIESILDTWKNKGHFFRNPDKWGTKQMAEYILHDPENPGRIEELSETLIFAQQKGVPIFIVTNNNIPRKNKQIFIDIFDEIGIKINRDCIFGGGSKYGEGNRKEDVIRSKIYDIIDKQAKIQIDAYKSTAMGKKKTKKKQKKQKQTKKKQKKHKQTKKKKNSKKKRKLRK